MRPLPFGKGWEGTGHEPEGNAEIPPRAPGQTRKRLHPCPLAARQVEAGWWRLTARRVSFLERQEPV